MGEGEVRLQSAGWKIPSDLAVSWLAYQVSQCPWVVTLGKESCPEGSQTQGFDLKSTATFRLLFSIMLSSWRSRDTTLPGHVLVRV